MAAVREPLTNFLVDSFYITLFDILQGLILSLLLLVFLTALFSPTVKRSKTWFIFMGSVIEWCASYLILIGQQIGSPPPVALCTIQSAGIYSSNPLCVAAFHGLSFCWLFCDQFICPTASLVPHLLWFSRSVFMVLSFCLLDLCWHFLVLQLFIKLKAALNRTGPMSVKWSWGVSLYSFQPFMV